ncbi:prepilin peptidase [Brevibacterium sp. GP-SGM9]|uniref:prepilin peptidase n=1 Tax=Brevibacterium sp. GP-SGM9 TaxID=3376990 RepID=UPI0039A6B00F
MTAHVLHGMFIGLTVLVGLAGGLLLSRGTRWWLSDDSRISLVTGRRLGPAMMFGGVLLAAAAALLFPASAVIPADTVHTAAAQLTGDVSAPNSADLILTAVVLGAVAASTPFLIIFDIRIRRLPDRIVYPLILLILTALVLGTVIGHSLNWYTGFIAGVAATLLFLALHLLGRLLRARTLGFGDVKLAFVVFALAGLFDQWAPALVLIAMMLIAGVWAIISALRSRRLAGTTIAFGPAMLSGMWLGSVLAPFLL